jgi:hypothetical protein
MTKVQESQRAMFLQGRGLLDTYDGVAYQASY